MPGPHIELIRTYSVNDTIRPDRLANVIRIRPGVYVDQTQWKDATPWERSHQRIVAFRLGNPTAVLSHESAAAAHGLPTFGDQIRIHMFDDKASSLGRPSDAIRHRSTDPRQVVQTALGPATSVLDTMIDIGRVAPRAQALAVWDAALAMGINLGDVIARWKAQVSRRGIRNLGWLTDRADARAESVGESVSRALIEFLGYSLPDIQAQIVTPEGRWRADFFWPGQRVVGEFDGWGKYLLDQAGAGQSLRAEKRREDALRRAGYEVVRWEYRDLMTPDSLDERFRATRLPRVRPREHVQLDTFRGATGMGTP